LNNRGKVGQLGIGIEDGFMMGAKNKWIKGNLLWQEYYGIWEIKAFLV
jgi:hypothetical protein